MAAPGVSFKTNYAVTRKIEAFYKGGKIQINQDGTHLFCTCGNKLNILDIETGSVSHTIEQDDQEDITSFALSPDDEILVTASRALLLKQWEWKEGKCLRTWKAIHAAPVASMTFDPTSTLLATGGCDSTIKIWDVIKQYCTHNLKGSSGVVHLVQFHPDMSRLQLFSSSMDYKIRIWDLKTSKCLFVLETHYSLVTSLAFSLEGDSMISSGRDKICTVWDLNSKSPKRTVPVYEGGGYDLDIFTESPDPDLLCSICHGVMRCPVMISCGHIFCRKCILQWLKRHKTCPCCRTELKGKMFVLMHKLKRKINRLEVKCPNEQNGCPAHFPLLRCDEHAESCAFGIVGCPNDHCPAIVLRKDMYQHSQSCEHWRELCHMGCGTMLMPENRDQHNCYMELKENYVQQLNKLRQKAKRMESISSQISKQIQLISDSLESVEPTLITQQLE